jgi:amino acid adenylation domain-containing protein
MIYRLSHLLHGSASLWPEKTAVVENGRELGYGELLSASRRLATTLAALGVGPQDRVGIYLPKSTHAVTAIFAALECGAVYVPIDPASPPKRAAYIVRDCEARCLVTNKQRFVPLMAELEADGLKAPPVIVVDATTPELEVLRQGPPAVSSGLFTWADAEAAPEMASPFDGPETDLAYILYTSGSTGAPKGVMISHQAALSFIRWTKRQFEIDQDDVVTSHAPFHFDLSIFDVFTSISSGATVVLIPEYLTGFAMDVVRLIREQGVTTWYSVPSALVLLMTKGKLLEDPPPTLRLILFAGEVFPPKYLRMLRAGVSARMFNLYGPTETNVCTFYEVVDPPSAEVPIPIGRAINNYEVFAVDDLGQQVDPGGTGQLMARGPGLMTGYWGRPDLTSKAIIQNPLHDLWHDPVCATGDLVQPHEDGDFRFVGRQDHMVKVRGYRVELGEVEATLLSHEAVHEAAAGVIGEGPDASLRAWVSVKDGHAAGSAELLEHCRARVAKYMIPEWVEVLSSLPRTSNGKIDRQGLQQGAVRHRS